jgi:hypothetical protein
LFTKGAFVLTFDFTTVYLSSRAFPALILERSFHPTTDKRSGMLPGFNDGFVHQQEAIY